MLQEYPQWLHKSFRQKYISTHQEILYCVAKGNALEEKYVERLEQARLLGILPV